MRRSIVILAVVAATLFLVVDAQSKTITGSPRNDHLRGTNRGDVIDGRGGNDSIQGLGGADRLIGGKGNDKISGGKGNDTITAGPGKDTISCGPGVDRVTGDPSDTAADDCENVEGLTPPPLADEGHYAVIGDWFAFDVATGGRTITGLRVRLFMSCPSGLRLFIPTVLDDVISIQDDHTFAIDVTKPDGFRQRVTVAGRFDGTSASGTVRLQASLNGSACDSGTTPWSATRAG